MGKASVVAVAISCVLGCVHAPKNKPRAYVTGALSIVVGGTMAYVMHERSCDDGSVGDNIGCGIGSGLVALFGLTLVGAGVATIGITALAPEAK